MIHKDSPLRTRCTTLPRDRDVAELFLKALGWALRAVVLEIVLEGEEAEAGVEVPTRRVCPGWMSALLS